MPIRVLRTELSARESALVEQYHEAMIMGVSAAARNAARLVLRHYLFRAREGGAPVDPQVTASVKIWQDRAGGPVTTLLRGRMRGVEPTNPIPAEEWAGPWHDAQAMAEREHTCARDGHIRRWYAFTAGIPAGDPPLVSDGCAHCGAHFHAYTHEPA